MGQKGVTKKTRKLLETNTPNTGRSRAGGNTVIISQLNDLKPIASLHTVGSRKKVRAK